ncbi:MAG: TonB-dependent receptor [Bacteroidota bacterium]
MLTLRKAIGIALCIFFSLHSFSQTKSPLTLEWKGQESYSDFSSFLTDFSDQSPVPVYIKSQPSTEKAVSFSPSVNTLEEVLELALDPLNLGYMLYMDQVLIIMPSEVLAQLDQYESLQNVAGAEQNLEAADRVLGNKLLPALDDTLSIYGVLRDQETQKPIEGARIGLPDQQTFVFSNPEGVFTLRMAKGRQNLWVQKLGYEPLREVIEVWGLDSLEMEISEEPYSLEEVLVQARSTDANIRTLDVGLTELSIKSIKEIPAFMGETDLVKSLISLPGVSSVGEGASGFNVRGGGVGQNLIMMDDGLIFNSSHALGFFSVFHADAMEKVSLFKGHVPARFGGRNSSVMEVKVKDGDLENFHGSGGIGLFASRLQLEGPILRDKVSFNVAGRFSYSDWLLGLANDPEVNSSSASFNDINAKLSWRLSDEARISASWFQSADEFSFSDEFGYGWESTVGHAEWRQIFSDELTSLVSISTGSYKSDLYEPEGQAAFTLENGIDFYKVKPTFNYNPIPGHRFEFGAEWVRYEMRPETINPRGDQSSILSRTLDKDQGNELSFFIEDEIDINDLFGISIGLRYSSFQQTGPELSYEYEEGAPREVFTTTDSVLFASGDNVQNYSGLEPRISFRWLLDETSSLKLSYNRMRQYIHLISNTTATTPVDFWQISTRYIPPTVSDNYSIGYYRNFASNLWETSLEAYYRQGKDVVSYKDLPELLLNPQLETEVLPAESRAYGVELSVKKTSGKLRGWIAYAYARTQLRAIGQFPSEIINEGDWFPANWEKPHQLNLLATVQANTRNTVSLNFTYESGRPVTAPVGNYQIGNTLVPQYSFRNAFRIPDYHRLDLSWTTDNGIIKRRKFKSSYTFAIYNLYARRNPFSIFFRRDDGVSRAFRLSVIGTMIPSVTYNLRF